MTTLTTDKANHWHYIRKADPSSDIYRSESHPLDPLFLPKSVAVIGATERAGQRRPHRAVEPAQQSFRRHGISGQPQTLQRAGHQGVPSVRELPDKVDLAVITTPADTVPDVIAECVEMGVPAGIVISAGFKEYGEHGKELERQISQHLQGKMRLIGPNCLGVMNPMRGLNATFAHTVARPGNVAFISQSGALCTAVLDWSLRENVGFSAFVSIGSMLDVDWGDLIDYFGNDPRTTALFSTWNRSATRARSFLPRARFRSPSRSSSSRPAALQPPPKPRLRTPVRWPAATMFSTQPSAAAAFCASTASPTSSSWPTCWPNSRVPRGKRLCILTNAGGPGVLATDALVNGGGELADLSPETMEAFDEILPAHWSHNNPVDILGDAEPERYAKSLEIAAKDPSIDGMLVVLTPQEMTDPTQIAEKLKPYAKSLGKPVLASWMGGDEVAAGEEILKQAGIPTFPFPDSRRPRLQLHVAIRRQPEGLLRDPSVAAASRCRGPARQSRAHYPAKSAKSGRTILTEYESKQVLKAYGIPTVETRIATTEQEAVASRRGDRLSGSAEALLADHHPQDRRRRRAAQPARCGRGEDGIPDHQAGGHREGRRRALPGRHRAAHGQAGRLRADHRQQPGSAVRSRSCCSAPAASWWRSSRTAPWRCRR